MNTVPSIFQLLTELNTRTKEEISDIIITFPCLDTTQDNMTQWKVDDPVTYHIFLKVNNEDSPHQKPKTHKQFTKGSETKSHQT